MIKLFDSLAHPTLTGRWLKGEPAGFDELVRDLLAAGFLGACAVGIAGVEGYSHEPFLRACRKHPCLVPIAGFDGKEPPDRIAALKKMGFQGIKVHPRFSGPDIGSPVLGEIFAEAARQDLPVFYCTYAHGPVVRYPAVDPLYALVAALKRAPEARVLLLHGGDVQVLRYAELVRFNPNLLLDLSLTLMKYRGSSLDADLSYLFRNFDRRLCVGTDHPESGHAALRSRFEELARGLAREKAENIGFRNLLAFLGRTDLA